MPKAVSGSFDTNIVLRLLVNDVPDQTAAAKQLVEQSSLIAVEDICIIETIFVISRYYEMPRSVVAKVMQAFFENARFLIDRDTFREALKLFQNHPALSIEDCYLAVKAKSRNATPLWTFDKKLANQSSGLAKLVNDQAQV